MALLSDQASTRVPKGYSCAHALMPELPEVETIVRELDARLRGKCFADVQVRRVHALMGVPPERFCASLRTRQIQGVQRRGKYLLFQLHPQAWLIAHLRMSGKFVLAPASSPWGAHHRVRFQVAPEEVLIFQDARCFGTLSVVESLKQAAALSSLGVEPLSPAFSAKRLHEALQSHRATLKPWLMDQRRIAGLGNIYAMEILFAARISPLRRTNTLSEAEAQALHRATRKILRQAIACNGTTISDFRRVDSKTGSFQHMLRVYGRQGKACSRCETTLAQIRQQQRSTCFCPRCQT